MNVIALLSLLFLVGCQTKGVVVKDVPLNVSQTRKAIVSVAGEPRAVSQNGRELLSRYYDRDGRFILKMETAQERFFTHFTVLGDRRPYNISVRVHRELKSEAGVFEFVEHDEGRAYSIAEKLRQALIESRDNRNLLDDFRSF